VNKKLSRQRHEVKIKTTKENITSRSGLLLLEELIHRIDAAQILDENLRLKKRNRGYSESEFILSLVYALLDGASCLDDIQRLRDDKQTQDLLQMNGVPHATTIGDFLRRFYIGHIYQFNKALRVIGEKFHQIDSPETVGLDIDSWVGEKHGHQQGVSLAYNGKEGYHPQFVFRTDTKECVWTRLQNGSAYSGRQAVRMFRDMLKAVPQKTLNIRVRADSAWYQEKFLLECERCKTRKVIYYITADTYNTLAGAIDRLPSKAWQPFHETEEVAEVRYAKSQNRVSRRYVVKRIEKKPDNSQQVMDFARYRYHIIVTNDKDRSAAECMEYSMGRGSMENNFKELVYGLSLNHFPCEEFMANWAYLLIVILAYNLAAWLRAYGIPEKNKTIMLKAMRYRFFHVAGRVVKEARGYWLAIQENYTYLKDFLATIKRLRAFRFT
jgi:hypothetical protein